MHGDVSANASVAQGTRQIGNPQINNPADSNLQHVDACLPITALKTFDWDARNLIFQGQGPHFKVVDDRTGNVCAQSRIFRRNNVHGFIILPQWRSGNGRDYVQIVVWGGRSLRAVQLALGPDDAVSLSSSSAEYLAPDWIMSGCPAVAHQPDTAYLLTANNALLSMDLQMEPKNHMKLYVHQLATSVKCLLYSADLIALSATHVLISAGTVFGEIIVWSCFIDGNQPSKANGTGSIHHFFTGHEGSIFGVRISPKIPSLNGDNFGRLLASCSDDRTVRIWDISDCEKKTAQDPSPYSTDGFELRSTGFGGVAGEERTVGSEFCLAQAYGHGARIWSVDFRPLRENQAGKIGLVTRGEDCTCVVWDLTWKNSSTQRQYQLQEISSQHHHTGKHIWSQDLCARGEETAVYTGGTDGALKCFTIKEDPSLLSQQGREMKETQSRIGTKAFDFVARDCLVGCSPNGEIHVGSVGTGESPSVTWETIHTAEDPHSSLVITGVPRKQLALIGDSRGTVKLYNHNTRSISDLVDLPYRPLVLFALENHLNPEALSCLVTYPTDDQATLVKVTGWDGDCPQAEAMTFHLPRSPFEVSCAAVVNNGKHLLIGSKLGGLAAYRVSDLDMSSQPLLENRRVHGREGTKHIQVVSSVPDVDRGGVEFVLTCGRDCYYCLHELRFDEGGNDTILFETVHRTSSGLDGTLEGGYFDDETGDLMVYGFKSQKFILRNESKLIDIASIASGGARRGWAFNPKVKGSEATLSWKEGSHLRTVRIRADLNRALRAGTHGREIRSMDGSDIVLGGRRIFATGGEDTTVRISALSEPTSASPWGSFESLRVLSTHKSGLQQVTWSNDGKFLFTSAAYEEFFVWRVRDIPSFGIATVLMAASPKDDPNSELRVTSFDVMEVRESAGDNGFLLCLTLSNSTIKVSWIRLYGRTSLTQYRYSISPRLTGAASLFWHEERT